MSMSSMSDVVLVPLATQLLAVAVAMQFVAFLAVLWRGVFGLPQLSSRRPRWPFIPLVIGAGAGVWYAWIKLDLLMGVAQGVALFIGYCLIMSSRGAQSASGLTTGTRSQRRAAEREAKRTSKRGESGQ
jgi:hypothetical protein